MTWEESEREKNDHASGIIGAKAGSNVKTQEMSNQACS